MRRIASVVLFGLLVAGCTTTSTGVVTQPISTHAGKTSKPLKEAPPTDALIGQAEQIKGESSGELIRVKPTKVVSDAHGADSFTTPDKGKRFYAVQFRITDVGPAPYNDSPSNGAVVIDSKGQQYQSDIGDDITAGSTMDSSVKLPPGESALGYIVFQVPKHAKIVKVQFGEDSGFGQTGEWEVQ